jgi:hypothetical protein
MPFKIYNLPEIEYMRWLDKQSEMEAVGLIMDALTKGSKIPEDERNKIPEYRLMVELVRDRGLADGNSDESDAGKDAIAGSV